MDSIWRRFFLTVTTCYDLTCPNFSNTPSLNAHNGGADEPISGLAIVSKPASVGNRMTRTSIHDTIFVSSPGVVCRLGNPAGAMMKWPSWYPQTLDILGLYCPVVPGEKEDLRRILPRLFNHAGVSLQDRLRLRGGGESHGRQCRRESPLPWIWFQRLCRCPFNPFYGDLRRWMMMNVDDLQMI